MSGRNALHFLHSSFRLGGSAARKPAGWLPSAAPDWRAMKRRQKKSLFELIVVIDFSAAAEVGKERPQEDRCWAAFSWGQWRSEPAYFRTRFSLIESLVPILDALSGPALIAWDFPFGYPMGSGMGGGRHVASKLLRLVKDDPTNRNNRFEVADRLNLQIGDLPGPFWGCPNGRKFAHLEPTKPSYESREYSEFRIVESKVLDAGYSTIQSVWKLNGTGSVGGQAIMGLATIERLNASLQGSQTVAYWPFETDWNKKLDGIVHAECWPSLTRLISTPYAFRDAQQVMCVRDELAAADKEGRLLEMLAPPPGLSPKEMDAAMNEEGWILGFPFR